MLEEVAGTDATREFTNIGHSNYACNILKKLKIGEIKVTFSMDNWPHLY